MACIGYQIQNVGIRSRIPLSSMTHFINMHWIKQYAFKWSTFFPGVRLEQEMNQTHTIYNRTAESGRQAKKGSCCTKGILYQMP